MASLLRRAGKAVALNAIANWFTLVATLVSTVLLARILTPADYGNYAMAMVAISIPQVLSMGVLSDSLVQRKDLRTSHVNSVFLQSMIISISLWVALILLSPFIANIFNNSEMIPVLIACGAVLPIGAMMSIPVALLQKDLRYEEITIVDVAGTTVAAVVGIVLALQLQNAWALVGMELSRRLMRLVAFMAFAKWVPSVASNWSDVRELARFNLVNGISKLITTFENTLPKSIISATLGASAVGVFNLAERLFDQMRLALIDPYSGVAMPVASMVQDDRPALHRAIENAIRMSAFLAYPTFIGAFIVAPLAIPVLFGEQWDTAIPIFQIFMIIALRSPMTAIISGVLRGVGRPDVIIWQSVISIAATILLLFGAYRFGLTAIAIALLVKQIINFVVNTWLIQKIVGFPILKQLQAGSTAFFASAIMGFVVWLAMNLLPIDSNPLMYLTFSILIGVAAYTLSLFGLAPRFGLLLARALIMLISGRPLKALNMVRNNISQ